MPEPRDATAPRYGYFGPAGTFTQQALMSVPELAGAEQTAFATVADALAAVRSGEVTASLVPIENSVEGGVSATLDNLAHGDALMIVREVLLPVRFALCARPGTTIEQVRRILTHPHAAAQCRDWVAAHLPDARMTEGPSTAGAAEQVSHPDSGWDAAICAPVAGELYGLDALADDIADNPDAVTRFVLVARTGTPPPPTGADKTTLVLFQYADHAGALLEILEQLAGRGVNLCRIESRPTRTALGSYCFSVDAEGHIGDDRMAEAMMGLRRICQLVIFLGSYPRADGVRPQLRRGTSNDDYAEARSWLERLRSPRP